MPSTRRAVLSAAAMLACVGGLTVGPATTARADDTAATMVVDGRVDASGELTVKETLTFPQGAPAKLEQRLDTTRDLLDKAQYEYTIDQVTATAGSTDLAPTVTTDGDQVVVTLDGSKAQKTPITISYRVVGASHAGTSVAGQPARTEVGWNVLQGLSVPVTEVSGTITTPGTISYVNCESGPAAGLSPCTTWGGGTHENPQPTFTDGPRAANDIVRVDFGMPATLVKSNSVVTHRWSLDRAFSVNPTTLLASLLPLLLGGGLLYWLHRRQGRDQASGRITPVAEFTPTGPGESRFTVLSDVRPGHVGTVADERVDPVDITATLLDLSVRGWLRIVELPRDRSHQPLDWRFERGESGEGELQPFEARLRDAVAPASGEGVRVGEIGPVVGNVVSGVQDDLYAEVVRRGWFDRRPDATRSRWTTLGWVGLGVAVLATIALVAFTTWGLLGIALIALALALLLVGQEMPRRTVAGTELLGGLSALASQLQTQPLNHLPAGREYHELSRILPYAVVLGGRDRWINALVAADKDETPDGEELGWYRAPDDWHLRDLPDSLNSFIVAVQGQMFGR